MGKNQKIRKAVTDFERVTDKQSRKAMADRRDYIKWLVEEYNAVRLPDEPIMTISEMEGQLERKCSVGKV